MNTIQEDLRTNIGVAGTLLIPKTIYATMIEEVQKTLVPRELAALYLPPSAIPGSDLTINLESENFLDVRVIGEGAEIWQDQDTYTYVTFTPVKYGVRVNITREMIEDSQFPLLQLHLRKAAKRFAEKETELVITALDSAANTVSGGAAITIANLTRAMQYLEDSDYTPTDVLIGAEVVNDLRNIDTFVEADKLGSREMLTRGMVGVIYGLRVYRFSTNAAPSTTYSKYAYVIDRSQAYGIAEKRTLTMENYKIETQDTEGAAFTWRFDVQLLRTSAVAKITTS